MKKARKIFLNNKSVIAIEEHSKEYSDSNESEGSETSEELKEEDIIPVKQKKMVNFTTDAEKRPDIGSAIIKE